jgi:hypothetical protein
MANTYYLILQHLAEYKSKVLNIDENGLYKNKEYTHILPKEKKEQNLINISFREDMKFVFKRLKNNIHPCFHHLNSSQALALNLFGPLEVQDHLEKVLSMIEVTDTVIKSKFEHVEDYTEGTNFDFYIEGEDKKYFFEVKYTEKNFAPVKKKDEEHIKKFENIYKPRLERFAKIDEKEFFKNYQIWRNLIYVDRGIVVFVFPAYRIDLERAIIKAILSMTMFQDRVRIIHIEDLCEVLENDESEVIKAHYQEFRRKYLQLE